MTNESCGKRTMLLIGEDDRDRGTKTSDDGEKSCQTEILRIESPGIKGGVSCMKEHSRARLDAWRRNSSIRKKRPRKLKQFKRRKNPYAAYLSIYGSKCWAANGTLTGGKRSLAEAAEVMAAIQMSTERCHYNGLLAPKAARNTTWLTLLPNEKMPSLENRSARLSVIRIGQLSSPILNGATSSPWRPDMTRRRTTRDQAKRKTASVQLL